MLDSERSSKRVEVYQCFHKPYPSPPGREWISPIGAGNYRYPDGLSESEGFSISSLNFAYNELTILYWIWKNSNASIVGLYHYRRVMAYKYDNTWKDPFGFSIEASDFTLDYFTSDEQYSALQGLLSCSDIVIPRLTVSEGTVTAHYLKYHDEESWRVFYDVVREKKPELAPYLVLFDTTNLCTAFNMFVMPKPLFDAYCADLFLVIDEVFERVGPRVHPYLRRYPGFLGERFMLLWIRHHRLRVAEVPMILLEEPKA